MPDRTSKQTPGFELVHLDDLPPTQCPCGTTRRAFVETPDAPASLHRVTIDTDAKTYTLDCFKFLCDATDGKESNQYPGWPITIHQAENKGENRIG